MLYRSVPAIAGILLLLAACAGNPSAWQKPGMTDESKAADMRRCRDYAHERLRSRAVRQTEGDNARAEAAQDTAHNDDMSGVRLMLEADQMRLERSFYEECMLANGYHQAK